MFSLPSIYFWEVSDPVAVNWYTTDDGNIYAYPNSSITPQDVEQCEDLSSNQTFLVRKDIYDTNLNLLCGVRMTY